MKYINIRIIIGKRSLPEQGKDTRRLPNQVRDVRRPGGGRGLRGEITKRVDGVFPGRPRLGAFGINADQWMTAAQDEGE